MPFAPGRPRFLPLWQIELIAEHLPVLSHENGCLMIGVLHEEMGIIPVESGLAETLQVPEQDLLTVIKRIKPY